MSSKTRSRRPSSSRTTRREPGRSAAKAPTGVSNAEQARSLPAPPREMSVLDQVAAQAATPVTAQGQGAVIRTSSGMIVTFEDETDGAARASSPAQASTAQGQGGVIRTSSGMIVTFEDETDGPAASSPAAPEPTRSERAAGLDERQRAREEKKKESDVLRTQSGMLIDLEDDQA